MGLRERERNPMQGTTQKSYKKKKSPSVSQR